MRVIEKIEVSKLKYGCVVVTQNFLFNYSLFKIILNPSKKVEFSSENQKDMSVDGNCFGWPKRCSKSTLKLIRTIDLDKLENFLKGCKLYNIVALFLAFIIAFLTPSLHQKV